jgi:hypothetical protein
MPDSANRSWAAPGSVMERRPPGRRERKHSTSIATTPIPARVRAVTRFMSTSTIAGLWSACADLEQEQGGFDAHLSPLVPRRRLRLMLHAMDGTNGWPARPSFPTPRHRGAWLSAAAAGPEPYAAARQAVGPWVGDRNVGLHFRFFPAYVRRHPPSHLGYGPRLRVAVDLYFRMVRGGASMVLTVMAWAHAGSDYTVFIAWLKAPLAASGMILLLIALFHYPRWVYRWWSRITSTRAPGLRR